ncbi:DUF938 domain-containing protein [Alteromonas sp. KUL49]|uniref:DUF938 domain-containing protein n=1 Tax=Alteromonas sp. KUL49 TaxID=2480798 RepID=UPI00102EF687|nr:DUF938 domain-containing protein [Alteromonas sp. KUL49]TAP34131.1 DUF938 domain-containing protein [Alteromonas sp. KUL49]GEA13612.1 hypothetical protein KUL49_39870 [Alteromonas sp. KUL49]
MSLINTTELPVNQAAEKNKKPIYEALSTLGLLDGTVFEIGSGTGQHGIYFCALAPSLKWQPSEVEERLPVLQAWAQVACEEGIDNFSSPVSYSIDQGQLPDVQASSLYCANVLHIIQPNQAKSLIEQVCDKLKQGERFICYGPFKKDGEFTTESNQEFHTWLQQQGYGGLIDIDDMARWSNGQLVLEHVVDMPSNNFLLVWRKG